MGRSPYLFIGKFLLLLVLVPLPSNAMALLGPMTSGSNLLGKVLSTYNALEQFHKEVVETGVEKLTPGQGAALQKLDSIYWDLRDLKNDIKHWQVKEEQKEIASKIDAMMSSVNKINQKYEEYERFRFNNSFAVNKLVVKAEPEMIKSFAESAISFDNGELSEIIRDMHTAFIGTGTLMDSVLGKLSHNKVS